MGTAGLLLLDFALVTLLEELLGNRESGFLGAAGHSRAGGNMLEHLDWDQEVMLLTHHFVCGWQESKEHFHSVSLLFC